MVNSSEFANRLQEILEYYGMSATAFSEEIQFNRSTISHLLSGRNKPSLEFVMKVIEKFPEVELYWLLNGKGSFPADKKKEISPAPHNPPKVIESSAEESIVNESSRIETIQKNSKIDRIVIFFEDGTFKSYESRRN